MAVRFVPGTRIPFYVACGFFAAPFWKFTLFLVVSGLAYVGVAFALFHAIGEAAGEQVRGWLPLIALGLVALALAWQGWTAWRRRRPAA
jgi:membrane protein DedA with SNARE-associated domain